MTNKEKVLKEIESHPLAPEIFDIEAFFHLKAIRVNAVDKTKGIALSGCPHYVDDAYDGIESMVDEYGKEITAEVFGLIKAFQDAQRAELVDKYGPDALNWNPAA